MSSTGRLISRAGNKKFLDQYWSLGHAPPLQKIPLKSVHNLPRYNTKCQFTPYLLMVKNPGIWSRIRDVKRSSNFRTSNYTFEFRCGFRSFDIPFQLALKRRRPFGIKIGDLSSHNELLCYDVRCDSSDATCMLMPPQSRWKDPLYSRSGGLTYAQGPHVTYENNFLVFLMFSKYLWRYSCIMKSTSSVVTYLVFEFLIPACFTYTDEPLTGEDKFKN